MDPSPDEPPRETPQLDELEPDTPKPAVVFRNGPIAVDELPRLNDQSFVSVDPRYLRASLVGTAITATIVLVLGLLVAWQADEGLVPGAVTGLILLLIGLSAVLRVLEVRRLAYQLREHDISLRSGVITHRVESLLFARVQHVRVNRGAIERALGLATLQISSAGPNVTIPGLAELDAERIKLLVTERAGMLAEDEVEHAESMADPAPPPPPQTPPPAPPMAPPFTEPHAPLASPQIPSAPPQTPPPPAPPQAPPTA